MKLTTKGRYAVTAMTDLAANRDDGPVALSDIALRQGISVGYLEQLFAKLRRAGLVQERARQDRRLFSCAQGVFDPRRRYCCGGR